MQNSRSYVGCGAVNLERVNLAADGLLGLELGLQPVVSLLLARLKLRALVVLWQAMSCWGYAEVRSADSGQDVSGKEGDSLPQKDLVQ